MFKKTVLIGVLILGLMLLTEAVVTIGFSRFQPQASFVLSPNEAVLTWTRLPFWAFYQVEVFNAFPRESGAGEAKQRPLKSFFTWRDDVKIGKDFPFPSYWRVSAWGFVQRPLGKWSEPILLEDLAAATTPHPPLLKPAETQNVSRNAMPPGHLILTWTTVPGAVYYEIEFLSRPPLAPNNVLPSKYRVHSSREVFVNGYHPDLRAFHGQRLYWRVRALDVAGDPIGVYSDAGAIDVPIVLVRPLKPIIMSDFSARNAVPLLYPVYSWVPVQGAVEYEVELTRVPPENPDTVEPSKHRIWDGRAKGFDLYDYTARLESGRYYYRVRGLGRDDEPVGVWSDAAYFDVDPRKGSYVATFGDSITHGGGSISYSPSDWEYSYQSYLTFPTYNLGRSSDTSEASAERFEQDVLPFHPKHLIIMTGTNSMRAGVAAENLISDLTTIREGCLRNDIRPIFLTLPPIRPNAIARTFQERTAPNWQEELLAVNEWVRQQPYHIDLYPHFVDESGELPEKYAIDGLHYDIAGKKLMAALINAHWDEMTR